MPTMQLKVRYFQDSTPRGVPCREKNFEQRELTFPLPVGQTALVLIDLWAEHHIDSWAERAERVTRETIVPLADRSRDAGLTVVHAPCPQVAEQYDVYHGHTPPPEPGPGPTWPPPEFRARQGEYNIFRGPRAQEPGVDWRWEGLERRMSPHIQVHDTDYVIATGQQLHDLCGERGILHLLVAGFATNWCILNRDYGIRAMSGRGYNTVLVRDATEGVEFPDTLDEGWGTELAVREAEQVWGFSTSTDDVYAALQSSTRAGESPDPPVIGTALTLDTVAGAREGSLLPAISASDRRIIRDLAKRVAEVAALPEQAEKVRLWTACNDLRPERAMVFLNPQNGWPDLHAKWMTQECEGETTQAYEQQLRLDLLRHEHIPDDYPILPTLDVGIPVRGAAYVDYGLNMEVARPADAAGAYRIVPDIQSEADLDRLHFRPIEIDMEMADQRVAEAQELLGDILGVRKVGKTTWRYGLSRVLIHMRGLEQMMLDMFDNPELLHRLMAFLRDDYAREMELFEQAGAITLNNTPQHINGSGGLSPTEDLPADDHTCTPRLEDSICWAESQECVGVGPAQFEEFVLAYQLPLMERFGLVEYGCCEPLEDKLELVLGNVPNLRWVAVVPWGRPEEMAERLGPNFVYVYKPNPSRLCSPEPAWGAVEAEIRNVLELTRKHGCPTHIVMKDTNTFHNDPERATRWAKMATGLAHEYA